MSAQRSTRSLEPEPSVMNEMALSLRPKDVTVSLLGSCYYDDMITSPSPEFEYWVASGTMLKDAGPVWANASSPSTKLPYSLSFLCILCMVSITV